MVHNEYIKYLLKQLNEQNIAINGLYVLFRKEKGYLNENQLKIYRSFINQYILVKIQTEELITMMQGEELVDFTGIDPQIFMTEVYLN